MTVQGRVDTAAPIYLRQWSIVAAACTKTVLLAEKYKDIYLIAESIILQGSAKQVIPRLPELAPSTVAT